MWTIKESRKLILFMKELPDKLLDSRLLLNAHYVTLYINPELVLVFLINYTVQSSIIKY